jgi:hypothetical protein
MTNKIYLSPFYRESMTANTNYTYTLTVSPPDGVNSVASSIITFDAYINPTRTFNLWVNGIACNNPSYTVSTTYAGAGRAVLYFDCSNVITKSGTYQITMRITGGNIGATSAWAEISYINEPRGSAKVHGTEYTFGQTAKVWLQLVNSNGTTVENGVCYTDIYSPDGDEYLERATMTNMNHDGIYHYDLAVPDEEGVYPVIALCYYEAGQTFNFPSSYEVGIGSHDSGTVGDLVSVDNTFIRFKESAVNPVRNISINITLPAYTCSNVSEALLTGISVRTVSRFDSVANDDVTISIYNYTSQTWIALPNKIIEGNVWRDVSDSVVTNNVTKSGFISGANGIKLRFTDTNLTDGATSNLDMDYLTVSCDRLASPTWQEVRGSSEIHVSAPTNLTFAAQEVWDYPTRNLTDYNGVWSYNGTINQSIIDKITLGVWNYTGTITSNILGQITNNIWAFASSVSSSIINQISNGVWNASVRNLTYYPNTQINVTVNSTTVFINETSIANSVWTNPERNLTYYESIDIVNYSKVNEGVWSYEGRYTHGETNT